MKKIILSAAILAVSFGAMAQKKSDSEYKNVVKVNPLGLLFGAANVSYEHVLSEKSAIQGNVQFGGLSFGGVKYTSLGAGADYKFYLSNTKEAPKGFYAAPGVGFNYTSVTDGTNKYSGTGATIRGIVGNQWVWESGFALDLFGGVNYYLGGEIKGAGSTTYGKFSGILPTIGVSLGYAF
jgi:Protein of unknown function (DUF3575)